VRLTLFDDLEDGVSLDVVAMWARGRKVKAFSLRHLFFFLSRIHLYCFLLQKSMSSLPLAIVIRQLQDGSTDQDRIRKIVKESREGRDSMQLLRRALSPVFSLQLDQSLESCLIGVPVAFDGSHGT